MSAPAVLVVRAVSGGGPVPTATFPRCLRTREKMTINGRLDEKAWRKAPRVRAFRRDRRGTLTRFHDHVSFNDEDVELFVQGDGYLCELGVNPITPLCEIRWTWVAPLVERRAHHARRELNRQDSSTGWTWSVMGNDTIHFSERLMRRLKVGGG